MCPILSHVHAGQEWTSVCLECARVIHIGAVGPHDESAAFEVTHMKADRRDREPFRTPVPSAPDPRVGPAGDGIRGEAVPAAGAFLFSSFTRCRGSPLALLRLMALQETASEPFSGGPPLREPMLTGVRGSHPSAARLAPGSAAHLPAAPAPKDPHLTRPIPPRTHVRHPARPHGGPPRAPGGPPAPTDRAPRPAPPPLLGPATACQSRRPTRASSAPSRPGPTAPHPPGPGAAHLAHAPADVRAGGGAPWAGVRPSPGTPLVRLPGAGRSRLSGPRGSSGPGPRSGGRLPPPWPWR
ncbi:hypothetical protein EDD27_6956 [Nonomuraea polychroma]|uniref:Uncharacterized protein n=1 Tax=Nonomuraea polychroma TaxID=46176 RepID=A0A438MEK5_9ACTN|nr:hypothetical protein EDD27_6956 [Nonomuraea polychroma]